MNQVLLQLEVSFIFGFHETSVKVYLSNTILIRQWGNQAQELPIFNHNIH